MRTDRRRTLALHVVLAGLLAVSARPIEAHHVAGHDQNPLPPPPLGPTDILHFEAGSLIIPMDGCYQRPTFMSDSEIDALIAPLNVNTAKCNRNAEKDDGIIPSYSLMFRLIQQGIPVNWAIRHGKSSFHDIDFSLVRAGGSPATHRKPGGPVNATKYSAITTIRYRGAPFIISAEHAAAALAYMDSVANTCASSPQDPSQVACYNQVDIHIAQVGFDAPIYRTVDSLPKMAVVDLGDPATEISQDRTQFLRNSITEALLADLEGSLFDWITIPDVFNDALVTGGYDLVWIPPFDTTRANDPTARQVAFMQKLGEFADAGGSVLVQDGAIGVAEGYGSMSGTTYVEDKPPTVGWMSDGGLVTNGISSTWDNGSAGENTIGQDFSDPAAQYGGIVWTGIGGSKYDWKPRYDRAYHPGVRRMIYSDGSNTADDNWEFGAWRRKDNDPDKGTIYYLGGFNWRRVTAAGFRVLLNTLLTTVANDPEQVVEVARSAPILAIVQGVEAQYQGTYETEFPPDSAPTFGSIADADSFEFPHVRGHMRAVDVGQLTVGQTSFDDIDASSALVFDAANHIPPVDYAGAGCPFPADGTCRRIFTEVQNGTSFDRLPVVQGNVATLAPLLGSSFDATAANTLIARIHAGRKNGTSWEAALGGVDRSTVAVIEDSPLLSTGRPTMLYFGGLDGMLHAVCAEQGPGCPAAGVELWAFMPSTELSKVATNTARIDGSPTVTDIFTGDGIRTVLTFQTGNRLPSATYALDITDPQEPEILWRLDTPGPGINTAMGWVRDGSRIRPMTFIQTATAPGTTSGFELYAVDSATGELIWSKTTEYAYPYPTRSDLNPEVPGTAMPGGVSLVPGASGTRIEYLLVPSLYGQVYKLDARTGENVLGTLPLFDFDEDFHPIGASVTLYRSLDDGQLRGLVVSGGFADPFAPSGTEWAPDDVHQYAVGFPVVVPEQATLPIRRVDVQNDPTLGIHIDFGAGQRAFSPAVVAGNELFITTDTANVNAADYGSTPDTGRLWRANLSESGSAATYVAIPSGAASVDVSISTGAVMTGGGDGIQRTNPVGFDAVGSSVEVLPEMYGSRRLWLRLR